jgi:hypothetical protein
MVQDRCHTYSTIEYMVYYLVEFHRQKDVVRHFLGSYSTKKDLEAVKQQLFMG